MWYLLATSVIWSFSFGLIKIFLSNIPSATITLLRLGFALIIFLPFLKLNFGFKKSLAFLSLGVLQFGIMYFLYFESFQYLKAFEVALFTLTTPIFVIVIDALIIRKMPKKITWIFVLSAVIGAGIIVYRDIVSPSLLKGLLLVQLSNIAFASGQILYRKLGKATSHKNALAFMYLGGLIFGIVASFFASGTLLIPLMTFTQWGVVIILLGAFASGLGFFWWNMGSTKVSAATLAVMNNLKIPLGIFVSVLVFGESTDYLRLTIGSTIVFASLIGVEFFTPSQPLR